MSMIACEAVVSQSAGTKAWSKAAPAALSNLPLKVKAKTICSK
jgi:hypothetical protein